MKQAKMAKKNGENQQTEGITRLTGFRFRKTATTTTTTTAINKRWYNLHQYIHTIEIRAQQEANKNLSQEEKQRLRKLKNEEKKAKKQQSQQSPKPTQGTSIQSSFIHSSP